ncbi:hypothetical protein [Nonomuraea sp. NPDC050643]|uniref:hypothetical protein n=1 Tax=Nonomuraea sp. NPDC050643 TaxID=3155660 RepID=UPI0033C4F13D
MIDQPLGGILRPPVLTRPLVAWRFRDGRPPLLVLGDLRQDAMHAVAHAGPTYGFTGLWPSRANVSFDGALAQGVHAVDVMVEASLYDPARAAAGRSAPAHVAAQRAGDAPRRPRMMTIDAYLVPGDVDWPPSKPAKAGPSGSPPWPGCAKCSRCRASGWPPTSKHPNQDAARRAETSPEFPGR